jgi:4-amino-4-deoxy-L-arabinose transferase-like glycosyltransferase
LLYPCLSFLLLEPDEGRYAEIPREMLQRGEWIVPYLQGEPYLDKPPLLYWMVMLSYRAFGVHDWAARLGPAFAVHACVLLTYLLGRRSVGERAAFWGALALSLAPGFISVGRLLVMDGLLTLFAMLSLLATFEAIRGERLHWRWWLVAASACGLGVLTKGPVALLLLAPPVAAHRWLAGRSCHISWRAALVFLAVVLAVCLPWYVGVCQRLPGFASYFFWKHNFLRFVLAFDHQEPIWFYVPILLVGLLPASLLGLSFARFLLSGDPATAERRSTQLGFMLLAGGWCVLFFSLSGSKLPTYILPAFPPFALALGCYISPSRWAQSVSTKLVTGAAIVLLLGLHYVTIPWFADFHSPMSHRETVARYCRGTPVICYPRECDSVAFYLGRDDFRSFRSKETKTLLQQLQNQPRTVVLCTHRHSLDGLRSVLPPNLRITSTNCLSKSWVSFSKLDSSRIEFCFMAVVEREASSLAQGPAR